PNNKACTGPNRERMTLNRERMAPKALKAWAAVNSKGIAEAEECRNLMAVPKAIPAASKVREPRQGAVLATPPPSALVSPTYCDSDVLQIQALAPPAGTPANTPPEERPDNRRNSRRLVLIL